MKHIRTSFVLAGIGILALSGCKTDPSFDPKKGEIAFNIPQGWPKPVYNFEGNPLSEAGFRLGKKLFFDPRLSRDNSISCGSCHQQFSAFAHFDHDFSHGVENRLGTRNSPPIFNLNWHGGFFWDGGVNHIELQPVNPIQNPVEMDEKVENVVSKLRADDEYRTMFRNTFGDDSITSQRMLKAIAQFMGLLVSSNSRYDKYVRGEEGGSMNEAELRGLSVYRSKCASCHTEPLFSDFSYRNNGRKPSALNDSGRARITLVAEDMYKFKVPSLRNLKYTAPYMHDGALKSLEAVLDHYASGIHQSPTLDPLLINGIQLTAQERSDLLQFLNTLNDEQFINDIRFRETQ